ncbi:iron chaperone [Aminobacter aganoensis]|uniref:Uncharacterized protein YdhG (YjbR/CyaY superfamily) n=1 Tax=Aminobacter aganoensis TaxID=83264 RepID=A0A7X0FC21_9HYPH|nr:DUF1801 domain-containing protein [Aminobacter aganoensis]MBB6356972.1 uncharacterized protein YdhG (YjbR/CyaY superfamily) [Aminobacter aganoensis]
MAKTDFKSVDEYIAAQPQAVQPILERLRKIIRDALPGAEEVISYQIPAYKLDAGRVIYFSGWKEHYSLYPVTERLVARLGAEVAPYVAGKGTLRFSLSEPIPARLIERIALLRAEEEADARKAKAAASHKARG